MRKFTGLARDVLDVDGSPFTEVTKAASLGCPVCGSPQEPEQRRPVPLRRCITKAMMEGTSEDPARAFDLALRIHAAGDVLEVEDQDYDIAVAAVKAYPWITLLKAQALRALEGQYEDTRTPDDFDPPDEEPAPRRKQRPARA